MTKKLLAFASALALSIVVLGAQAQKPSASKMAGKMPMAHAGMKPPASKGVTGTSKGTIKGAPTATGFTLTTAKGDQNVDSSKAKFRNASGQFVAADKATAGAPAEVTGTWKGRTLVASTVKLTALKAEKPAGKMGGKMSSKMGGKMAGHKLPK